MKLTVYYDDQFWVGVVEEVFDAKLKAVKFIFGPEPQDADVLRFVNYKMLELLADSKPLPLEALPKTKPANPKRLARQVAKEMQAKGVSTFSQEAIKADLQNRKTEKQHQVKLQRDELAKKKRQLAVLKAKAKHRGK